MAKPHIAFISFPHPPEVNPTIPIAAALVRRGYRVSFVTSDAFAARVASTGSEVVRCPEFDPRAIYTSPQDLHVWSPIGGLAVEMLGIARPLYAKDRPNLVVYDTLALAGRILANEWRVPAVQTTPIFALDQEALKAQIPDPEYRNVEVQFSNSADQFLQAHGVASTGFMFHREGLSIYLFPKLLQIPGGTLGDECFFAGRCAAEQPHYGTWRWIDRGIPCALISNSTTYSSGPEFFRKCIDAFSGLGWHVIMSIGSIDPEELAPLPGNFEIVRGVSHVQILAHVSLFICPGGIISQAEALYHGVPVIAASNGFAELEWVSDNVRRLGTGVHLKSSETSAAKIRAAVEYVVRDSSIRQNVKQFQKVVRGDAGGEATANVIEDYLEYAYK